MTEEKRKRFIDTMIEAGIDETIAKSFVYVMNGRNVEELEKLPDNTFRFKDTVSDETFVLVNNEVMTMMDNNEGFRKIRIPKLPRLE